LSIFTKKLQRSADPQLVRMRLRSMGKPHSIELQCRTVQLFVKPI